MTESSSVSKINDTSLVEFDSIHNGADAERNAPDQLMAFESEYNKAEKSILDQLVAFEYGRNSAEGIASGQLDAFEFGSINAEGGAPNWS